MNFIVGVGVERAENRVERSRASGKSGGAERSGKRELQKSDGAERSAEREVAERERSKE